MMANSITMSILVTIVLTMSGISADADKEITSDKSGEEFVADSTESLPSHDQNPDGTSNGNLDSFVNENPGNYYMDLYSIQTGPKQVEFGHVYENPDTWEKRYEKKDHENKRFQGQVSGKDSYNFSYRRGNKNHVIERREEANPHKGHFRIQALWGDKNGGYGEQYWDYNHGGQDQHDEPINEDPYVEPPLSVRSPPPMNPSHSPYNSIGYSTASTSAIPSTTHYPKRKYPKKNKKRYEDPPRKRLTKIPEASSTDGSYFTLPRERAIPQQRDNSDEGPLRIDLYEQLKALPTSYEHFVQITPTTPKSRTSTTRS